MLFWFRSVRWIIAAAGCAFFFILALPLTSIPWNWYRDLAYPGLQAVGEPHVIVMMGGGGIPSESGLMRSWKTAEAAALFPDASIIVAMPLEDGEIEPGIIARELIMRGVEPTRILREPQGRNTREQATEIRRMLTGMNVPDTLVVGLVTSPEHMKRTWFSFRKAGLESLVALPCWPEAISADLRYVESDLGAPSLGGMVGGSNMIKYRYWDNLAILVKCTREAVAYGYYWLLRWV